MHILAITKPPQFDAGGHPIRGQCERSTNGWQLRLRVVGQRHEEVLMEGSYHLLRRVQVECIGKSRDEIGAVVAEARRSMRESRSWDGQDTEIFDSKAVRKAMRDLDESQMHREPE